MPRYPERDETVYNHADVEEIIGNEGLSYAIENFISPHQITDPVLSQL